MSSRSDFEFSYEGLSLEVIQSPRLGKDSDRMGFACISPRMRSR